MDDMMELMLIQQQKQELIKVLDCNSYTGRFGVTLSDADARQLLCARKDSLKREERVEFKGGILPKLIYAFCDSPYVYQDNYVETIERLQEIFYLYKNECMDELNDDELLEYMQEHFNGDCQGSLDFLEETCLDELARRIRDKNDDYFERYLRKNSYMRGEEEDE